MMDFDATMEEGMDLDAVIEKASVHNEAKLCADAEWSTPKVHHVKTLVEALSYGIISSDPYYLGYVLPPNFVNIMDRMIGLLHTNPPGESMYECIKVSLIDFRTWAKKQFMLDPKFVEWNDAAGSGFVSRNTPTATGRQFIDLDCPPHNATIYLRDVTRRDEAFDADFEKRWKGRHES